MCPWSLSGWALLYSLVASIHLFQPTGDQIQRLLINEFPNFLHSTKLPFLTILSKIHQIIPDHVRTTLTHWPTYFPLDKYLPSWQRVTRHVDLESVQCSVISFSIGAATAGFSSLLSLVDGGLFLHIWRVSIVLEQHHSSLPICNLYIYCIKWSSYHLVHEVSPDSCVVCACRCQQ